MGGGRCVGNEMLSAVLGRVKIPTGDVRMPDQALTFFLGVDTNPVNQWIKNLIRSSISEDFDN